MLNKLGEFKSNGFGMVKFYETNNFRKFKCLKENRAIKKTHVEKLVSSINNRGYLFTLPIINSNWEVIDGQHRIEAFEKTGNPVTVAMVRDYTDEEIKVYNLNQHNWKDDDFLKYFIQKGYPEYITYGNFKELYKLPHSVCMFILSWSQKRMWGAKTRITKLFRDGDFVISDINSAHKFAKKLSDIQYTHRRAGNFVEAFFQVINTEGYDHTRMKHSFAKYGKDEHLQLPESGTTNPSFFVWGLQQIYNHRRPEKDYLVFMTAKDYKKLNFKM